MTNDTPPAATAQEPTDEATGNRWLPTWAAIYLVVLAWLAAWLALLTALTLSYA